MKKRGKKRISRRAKELLTIISVEISILTMLVAYSYFNSVYVFEAWVSFTIAFVWLLLQTGINGNFFINKFLAYIKLLDTSYKEKTATAANDETIFSNSNNI